MTRSIALALVFFPQTTFAKEVTVSLEATVDSVFDPSGKLRVGPGDVLRAVVTYDSEAPESDAGPFGIRLDAGAWKVATTEGAGAFRVSAVGEDGSLGFYSKANTTTGLAEAVRSVYWVGKILGIDLQAAAIRATVRKIETIERPEGPVLASR